MHVARRTLLLLAVVALWLAGCRRAEPAPSIRLPPTTVLSTRSSYGVVTENLLRIRSQPTKDGELLQHVRRGNIVEIITRTENMEEVEGTQAYWYLVDYSGLKGWVFGAYLQIAGSRSEAERLAASLE